MGKKYLLQELMKHVVALFGETEKGKYKVPYHLKALPELVDFLGNPPPETEGLFFAIQALLYDREIIFFRVEEEGFSKPDYLLGFRYLLDRGKGRSIHALCLPGVGDAEILNASQNLCELHKTHLITTQKDLYDYLTSTH